LDHFGVVNDQNFRGSGTLFLHTICKKIAKSAKIALNPEKMQKIFKQEENQTESKDVRISLY
jgi:hypothetical protein